jgi:hypothetical protein
LLQVSNPLRLQQWQALQCEADVNRDAGPVEAGFAPDSGTSGLNGAKVHVAACKLQLILLFGDYGCGRSPENMFLGMLENACTI